jgi:hypothetical protein
LNALVHDLHIGRPLDRLCGSHLSVKDLATVLCVLPAFLLVALMPFALAGLTSLPSTTLS